MNRVSVAIVMLVLLVSAGMANLFVNGDFEQPSEVGWQETAYSIAGTWRYERSDTFGSGTGFAMKARKDLAYYSSVVQTAPVTGLNTMLQFDARLVWGGGSTTCWPVAAIMVRYLDTNGKKLGTTSFYSHHASANWTNNDTAHLIEVTSAEWNRYQLNLQDELANLPGVLPADVAQIQFALYAYDNGT